MERKKVIILGGSSGIGKAIAQRFSEENWIVIIASSNQSKLDSTFFKLKGSNHESYQLDIRDEQQINDLADIVKEKHNNFDVFINSIGISEQKEVLNSDFNEWDKTLQVMLYGSVKSSRALMPFLKDGGRIINITSIHYNRVEKGSSAYGVAKAAITQFTRSLALELASRNILANTIAPGFVDTPMSIDSSGVNELETDWFYDNYIKYDHLPLKRAGKPEEVAGVAYFLAGPDATYITGTVITVDGGLTITF